MAKNNITLPEVKKTRKGPRWRTAQVLVSVPVEQAVTDKSVARWVRDAIEFAQDHNDYSTLEWACRPNKVGKPVVTEYHRHVRGKKNSERYKKSRAQLLAAAPGE